MLVPFKDIRVGAHFILPSGTGYSIAFKGRENGCTVDGRFRELSPLKEVDSSLPNPVGVGWPKY